MLNKTSKPVRNLSEGTTIGSGVKLVGSLRDEGPIVINGEAEGEITSSESIIIGQNALIRGPIKAKIVTVAGSVEGEIEAAEILEIMPTGQVNGKIEAETLIIKPGAIFIGQCIMKPSKPESVDFKPESEE